MFCKIDFLEISQNSQENTCGKNFIKKKSLPQVFSREFCEISKNTFSYRTPLVVDSFYRKRIIKTLYSEDYRVSHVERGESHIDFRTQCVIMTQTRWPPTPCHLCNSQNFDKSDSFLKPVLNICILGNLIAGWGGWVIKEGAGILYLIFSFSGGVNIWGRIHEIKSWYSLEPSHTSKVVFFAEIVFGCKPLTFFVKGYNLDVWLVL